MDDRLVGKARTFAEAVSAFVAVEREAMVANRARGLEEIEAIDRELAALSFDDGISENNEAIANACRR